MDKKRKVAALGAFFLGAALMLSSCAGGEENVESVTVALTTETAIEQTEEPTSKKEFLGDYTETETGVIEIMGSEYNANGFYGGLTIDADVCSEITKDDLNGIEILKDNGLWHIDVINCKGHDLSFLSPLKGIYMRFMDVDADGLELEYLPKLTGLRSVCFVSFEGDDKALISTLEDMDIESAVIYTNNFSVSNLELISGKDFAVSYRYNDFFNATAPSDRPYVTASPCVRTFIEDGTISNVVYLDKNHPKIRENGNIFTAYICNPTDEEIIIESMCVEDMRGEPIPMADGTSYKELGLSAAPGEEICFELTKDMFDYSSMESGIYKAVFYYGENGTERAESDLILKNSETAGLEELTEEQIEVFEKAYSYVSEYFGCSSFMTEEYASSHTAEDFIGQFLDAFTYDCAAELSESYIDENGNLKAIDGDRGSNITLVDECFYAERTADSIDIVCITSHFHSDVSYRTWLGFSNNVHMVLTDDGWRVDKFNVWW